MSIYNFRTALTNASVAILKARKAVDGAIHEAYKGMHGREEITLNNVRDHIRTAELGIQEVLLALAKEDSK